MITRRGVVGGLAAGVALPKCALAQAYPTHPIRIIVPFAPGGGADIVSRLISPYMQASLGQSVIVENRAGAAGPDRHRRGGEIRSRRPHAAGLDRVLAGDRAAHIGQSIGYDPAQGFRAGVAADLQHRDAGGASIAAGAEPAAVHGAGARQAGRAVLRVAQAWAVPIISAGEIFNRMTEAEDHPRAVPGHGARHPGGDLQSGAGDVGLHGGAHSAHPRRRAAALAVGGLERSKVLPEVPTVAEAGVPGYEAVSWIGMAAPAGLPAPVMNKLSGAVRAAMAEKAVTGQPGSAAALKWSQARPASSAR